MTGITDLSTLLTSMMPVLHPEEFVFCTLPPVQAQALPFMPLGLFWEEEGATVICQKAEAEAHHLPYSYICRRITLKVHSSLEAVGFLAAITQALAQAGISVNPVSAYYHDHLFVPAHQADQAMACLGRIGDASAG